MASSGWSLWNTDGELHFRTLTDADGQIRCYQWNNRNGYYTTSSDPGSARINRRAVEQYEQQAETSRPRTTTFPALTKTTQQAESNNLGTAISSDDFEYSLSSLSALNVDPSNSIQPDADDDPETAHSEDVPQISGDDLNRGMLWYGKPFEIHEDDVDVDALEIKSQGSVKVSAKLPPEFVVKNYKFFRRGRVFCAIHATAGGQDQKNAAMSDGTIYVTLRPMVVIQQEFGHCLVVPVFSYQRKGLLGKKLTEQQKQNHAVIHMKGTTPRSQPTEGMIHEPFTVTPAPYQSLMAKSRIRFDMWHTVQYNTKVKNLGMIAREQHERLMECFMATLRTPSMPSSSQTVLNNTLPGAWPANPQATN